MRLETLRRVARSNSSARFLFYILRETSRRTRALSKINEIDDEGGYYLQIEHTKGANVERKTHQRQGGILYGHQMLPKGRDHVGVHSDAARLGEKRKAVPVSFFEEKNQRRIIIIEILSC